MKQVQEKEPKEIELPPVIFDEFPAPDYEEWKQEVIETLKGADFAKKLLTKTYEEITLEPIYTMEMAPNPDDVSNLPGLENYMRGIHAGGYISNPWLIAQENDEVMPEKLNTLIRHELDKGATSINIAIDKRTKLGKNADSSLEDSGQSGVSLSTLQDVYHVFDGIDLAKYEVYINAGASSTMLIGMLGAMCKANSESFDNVHGMIGADPIGVLAEEGKLSCSLHDLYHEMAHTTVWTEKNMPALRNILVQGEVYNDGGASAVQELGYVLASAIEYIRAMQLRGIDIYTISKHMQFSFSLGSNFFMEIAKLRAARMMWAQIVESFGGDKEAQKMVIHARTAKANKTAYDPYVNMLRTTTEAFSGVVGGVDSLQVGVFDESIRLGDEFSRRIARNTQIILQNECNLRQPIDPAGGSWYIETLTKQVAQKAWEILQQVEKDGGMVAALRSGIVQQGIADVLKKRFKNLAKRVDRAVGVNMYANVLEEELEKHPLDKAAIQKVRAEQIKNFVEDIDEQYRDGKLKMLDQAVKSTYGEALEAVISAFTAGATLEEVSNALRKDETKEKIKTIVEKHRFTEQFEELRHKAKVYEAEHGKKLKIFLANMGPIPQHKPRAEFSTGFFEVGGFEVLKNDGFMTTDEAAKAATASGAFAAIICSTDDTYPELVPPVAEKIKADKPEMIVMLAGAPAPEHEPAYREAGVEEFIHVRSDCLQILTWLQQQGGIK